MGTLDSVGKITGELILDQLTEERKLKESLAQRSVAVISSGGTLVTISLGVSALVTRVQTFVVPQAALILIAIAVALLVAGSICALFVNAPWSHDFISIGQLRDGIGESMWGHEDSGAQSASFALRIQLIERMRARNKWRARLLLMALSAECLALAGLAVGVGVILSVGVGFKL